MKPVKDIIDDITKKHSDVTEIRLIPTPRITLANWVSLKCKYGCTMYGKSWSCPPETPDFDKATKILREYRTALFISLRPGDLDETILDIERMFFKAGYYRAFGFFTSPCSHCKSCFYPKECKHPEKKRPTSESIGVDIFRTAKNIGVNLNITEKPSMVNTIVLIE